MEDIVAIAVELEDGTERFFLTWGRIQHPVAQETYFYEGVFSFCQKERVPFGRQYEVWRTEMDKKMQGGKEIYYLGNRDHTSR